MTESCSEGPIGPFHPPKLLLFDIDGTLLLSRGSALKAMNSAGQSVFGPAFLFDEVDRFGRLDPHILAAALEHHGTRASEAECDAFRQAYFAALRSEIHLARVLPGVARLLDRLRQVDGLIFGLVTGNYQEAARIKLQAVGIEPDRFTANGFAEQAPDRASLVRLAIDRANHQAGIQIPGHDVVIIGDTPRDIECAAANDCHCLAVATGQFDASQLRAAGAKTVVPDLVDPTPLWEVLRNGENRS